jgi:hypothetical protein
VFRSKTLSSGGSLIVRAGTVISTIAAAVRAKMKAMYNGLFETSLLYRTDNERLEDDGEGVAILTEAPMAFRR